MPFTISSLVSYEEDIKKSRFQAFAVPVENEQAVKDFLEQYKDISTTHQCWAWKIGHNVRFNDDGEPSGSSGKPIYDAINKHGLKDVLVVVTRYFGGIKLGVGGLKRAYFDAADECLKISDKREVVLKARKIIEFNYGYISAVMNFIELNKINIIENNSTDKVKLICDVRFNMLEKFNTELFDITNGTILIY